MKHLEKIIVLVLLIMISNIVISQNTKNTKPPLTLYRTESGSFIFDTIVNVNGVSKAELYKRAKNWVVSNVRTSDNTNIFDDKEFNEIRTNITVKIPGFSGTPPKVNFKLAIYFKDNKFRIITESFIYFVISSYGLYEVEFEKLKSLATKKIYKSFDKEFTKFKNSLIQSLYKSSESDW